ncbi:hypothetical protein D623_10006162 [Myotis brandtii]|uniref:Uncharacterized protein n=1 Tax=Myotis brandtii TaxID=109478 RepID=S7MI70_MYOBR|nr:hypothetical protein D623_10006162 [Myotis brandtii]
MSEASKSDSNEIPTRSGQPRLELEEGSTGDARRARSPIPLRPRTEGQRDRHSRARDLPSGLALMKTRTLRPAGTRRRDRAVEGSRVNFILERRPEFLGSCLPRLQGRRGWGLGLPGGLPGFTGDDPERSRLPPGRKAGKTLARDHRCSAPSPKGHSSPEDVREGTRAGVSASLPKCREYGLKVRHTHGVRTPRVGSITLQNRFGRLGGSVTAALSLVAQVVLSFSSSRS